MTTQKVQIIALTLVALAIGIAGVLLIGRGPAVPQSLPTESPARQSTNVPPSQHSEPAVIASVMPLAFDRVETTQRLVALTFDCCQTQKPAGFDEKIVRFLIANKVPATFFLGGRWIEAHQKPTQTLASVPYFELENHSYLHPHMAKAAGPQVQAELVRTQQVLGAQAGRPARYFRPPFGEWNALVRDEAAKAGMQVVTWTISTGDPDRSADVNELMGEFRKARPGAVILMHANGRGWHTAEALPQMLAWLNQHELRPVTLENLVSHGQPRTITPHG